MHIMDLTPSYSSGWVRILGGGERLTLVNLRVALSRCEHQL